MKYLYIVFSSTPYWIGKAIRAVTNTAYNHVSISLTEDLSELYGFARRFYKLPLYGGFVKESLARYSPKGKCSRICLCRIPVSEGVYEEIAKKLRKMYAHRETYLYNHLSALSTPFRRWIRCRDAYICVEFVVELLSRAGITKNKYHSIKDLLRKLDSFRIYEGSVPEATEPDEEYFAERPVPHPVIVTLKSLLALPGRIIK